MQGQNWSSIGLFAIAAAVLLFFALRAIFKKPAHPTPVEPLTPVTTTKPCPEFLGWMWQEVSPKYRFQFGEIISLDPRPGFHGVDYTPGGQPSQTDGLCDNGSGPYEMLLRAEVMRTGVQIPIYDRTGPMGSAGNEIHGKRVPLLAAMLYGLGKKPWSQVGALINCNEFVPLDDYLDQLPAGSDGKMRCGGTTTPVVHLTDDLLEWVKITATFWNADGDSRSYSTKIQVEKRSCA